MAIVGFGKASLENITNLEKKYNLLIPDDYKNFLVNCNGGDVDEDAGIFVESLKENIHIDSLLGVDIGNADIDVDSWTDDYLSDLDENMLIIGHSYEHGFIVLQCCGKGAGVYYWDHSYEFDCSDDESKTCFMTNTFSDFIKLII